MFRLETEKITEINEKIYEKIEKNYSISDLSEEEMLYSIANMLSLLSDDDELFNLTLLIIFEIAGLDPNEMDGKDIKEIIESLQFLSEDDILSILKLVTLQTSLYLGLKEENETT